MATTTKIPDGDSQFKGLSPVGYYSENGLYKYTFGTTTNKKEALSLLQKVKEKFSGAFLVKFKNGNKIK